MLSPHVRLRFDAQAEWLERHDVQRPPAWYSVAKRRLDLSLIVLSAPLWVPVFMLCAVLVKLESPLDPLFFSQQRTGKHGRRFKMHKFRTMVRDAEALKSALREESDLKWPDFSLAKDPRVTRVGHLLRKSGLDELPQLLNVLIGEMSLVGPRPTSFSADTYKLWHTERLEVSPGLTGLWQIMARGTVEFDDRLRLDIAYIERRCLRLDIEIILRTPFSLVLLSE